MDSLKKLTATLVDTGHKEVFLLHGGHKEHSAGEAQGGGAGGSSPAGASPALLSTSCGTSPAPGGSGKSPILHSSSGTSPKPSGFALLFLSVGSRSFCLIGAMNSCGERERLRNRIVTTLRF